MARSQPGEPIPRDVEHQRDDILQQAQAHRRVSVIPQDASAGAKHAETPWDISNIPQLQYWAKHQPAQLLQSLNELRQERDAALSCIEEWSDMVDKVDRANGAAISAQHQRKVAQEKVRTLQSRNIELEDQYTRLEERIGELQADRSPKRQETPSLTVSGSKTCTPKVPDPPLYCEIDGDLAIEDWTQQIHDKLTINEDHFKDDAARTIYVISHTGGTAAKHIQAYRTNDPEYFTNPEEVFSTLSDIMGNPNKKDDMRRGFKTLRQKATDTFTTFFSQFRIYTNYLKLDEETIIDELKDKVNLRLQDAIAATPYNFRTLKELSDLYQRVDNQQRHISEKRKRMASASTRSSTRTPPATTRRTSPAYVPTAKRQSLEPTVVIAPRPVPPHKDRPPAKAQDSKRCYNCDKEGHFTTDCPERRKEAVRRIGNDGDQADEVEEKEYSGISEAEGYSESEN